MLGWCGGKEIGRQLVDLPCGPEMVSMVNAVLLSVGVASTVLIASGLLCVLDGDEGGMCPRAPVFILDAAEDRLGVGVCLLMLGISTLMPVILTMCCERRCSGSVDGMNSASINGPNSPNDAVGAAIALYGSRFLSAWGDRLAQFAVPVIFIFIFEDTLLPSALYQLLVYFSCVQFMPAVGAWVDRNGRLYIQRVALTIENLSLVMCCLSLVGFLLVGPAIGHRKAVSNSTDVIPGRFDPGAASKDRCAPDEAQSEKKHTNAFHWTPQFIMVFSAVVLFGIVGELFNQAQKLAVEKDWVVVIAPSTAKLQEMNTRIRRIDLLCKVLAPTTVGFILDASGDNPREKIFWGALLVAAYNLLSYPLELLLNTKVYNSHTALASKKHEHEDGLVHAHEGGHIQHSHGKNDSDEEHGHHLHRHDSDDMPDGEGARRASAERLHLSTGKVVVKHGSGACCSTFQRGVALYVGHEVFWASISYALLWFTVLTNGGLMTAYLEWRGVPSSIVGLSRGAGAVFGLAGTFVFPFIQRLTSSVESAALYSIWLFWILLLPAMVSFYMAGETLVSDYVLMASCVVSRVGLWSFDLAQTQIMQTRVAEAKRGIINATQASAYQMAFVMIQVMGMIFHDPCDFTVLVSISVVTVACSALAFTYWHYRIGKLSLNVDLDVGQQLLEHNFNHDGRNSEDA